MARIFISYARDDGSAIAQELANRLRAINHDVFLDIHGIPGGTEWEKQLIQRGRWCDVLVLLITEASNQSKYVYHEFREAEKNKKLIIPVQIDDTPIPPHVSHLNVLPFVNGNYDGLLLQIEMALRHRASAKPAGGVFRLGAILAAAVVLIALVLIVVSLVSRDNEAGDQPLTAQAAAATTALIATEAFTATEAVTATETATATTAATATTTATETAMATETSVPTPIPATPTPTVDLLQWYLGGKECDFAQQDNATTFSGSGCLLDIGLPVVEESVLSARLKLGTDDSTPTEAPVETRLEFRGDRDSFGAFCGLSSGEDGVIGFFTVNAPASGSLRYENSIILEFDRWYTFQLQADPSDNAISCSIDGELLGSYRPESSVEIVIEGIYHQIFAGWNASVAMVESNALPGYGFIDIPRQNALVSGTFDVSGWAMVSQGVKQIEIVVDGESVSQARYGLPREDVFDNYPELPVAAESGFEGQVNSRQLTNGRHTLEVWVVDNSDARSLLADPVTINVNN